MARDITLLMRKKNQKDKARKRCLPIKHMHTHSTSLSKAAWVGTGVAFSRDQGKKKNTGSIIEPEPKGNTKLEGTKIETALSLLCVCTDMVLDCAPVLPLWPPTPLLLPLLLSWLRVCNCPVILASNDIFNQDTKSLNHGEALFRGKVYDHTSTSNRGLEKDALCKWFSW